MAKGARNLGLNPHWCLVSPPENQATGTAIWEQQNYLPIWRTFSRTFCHPYHKQSTFSHYVWWHLPVSDVNNPLWLYYRLWLASGFILAILPPPILHSRDPKKFLRISKDVSDTLFLGLKHLSCPSFIWLTLRILWVSAYIALFRQCSLAPWLEQELRRCVPSASVLSDQQQHSWHYTDYLATLSSQLDWRPTLSPTAAGIEVVWFTTVSPTSDSTC